MIERLKEEEHRQLAGYNRAEPLTNFPVLVVLGISIALATVPFSEKTELMLRLLRLMFPYMFLVCLAAVFIGMANARGHFFVPALGAVVLNVIMIASVLLLAPHMGRTLQQQIFGLAIGVLLAGLAQAFFQGRFFFGLSPGQPPL